MTTKIEMIAIIKKENPTLQIGSDEEGYTQLPAAEYELQIGLWADNRLAKEAETIAEATEATAKAALLKRLGITADEAKLLLS